MPVQQFMPAALAEVLRKAPLTPEKVAFAWRTAVGPAMAKATTVDLRDGVLRVRARDTTWLREVERSAPLIRSRLSTVLGNVVGSIETNRG
jgi:predicted nucleic acid-binding Zn ribbon protein